MMEMKGQIPVEGHKIGNAKVEGTESSKGRSKSDRFRIVPCA